jgi:hypothetical protein
MITGTFLRIELREVGIGHVQSAETVKNAPKHL